MDAAAVATRSTTYTFGQYCAGEFSPLRDSSIQDADDVFLSPSSSSSWDESSRRQAKSLTVSGPPRQRRKRARSWSTTSTDRGAHFPVSPAASAACGSSFERTDISPLQQGDSSPLQRGDRPSENVDDRPIQGGSPLKRVGDGERGLGRPSRSAVANATAPRDTGLTGGRQLGEHGVSLLVRDGDDDNTDDDDDDDDDDDGGAAADDEFMTREEAGNGEVVVGEGSPGEAEGKEACGGGSTDGDDGPSWARRGGEDRRRQSPGGESGKKGVATPDARQQQQQQVVHVVVHEVLSEDFGLFTWPSGVVLAYLIWTRRREFRGVSVVEIGAGTALPGLLAAKLGARVVLTDREGAPWVLKNMRGAVAANGLAAVNGDATVAPAAASAASAAGRDGASGAASPAGDNIPHNPDARCVGDSAVAGGRGAGGEADKEGGGSGNGARGGVEQGSCSVRGLSWGSVGPASIKMAREQWRPQVVLGADVFYSSEHFDSVLATAFMLLSATLCSSGGGGGGGGDGGGSGGSGGAGVDVNSSATHIGSSMWCGVANGSADASARTSSAKDAFAADAAVVASAEAVASTTTDRESPTTSACTPQASSLESTPDAADSTAAISSTYGRPFSRSKGVFLTAYHERSARRSLRPLLRKWGMEARVLHDAPRKVLPPSLWESGRYDSVALLEITLMQ